MSAGPVYCPFYCEENIWWLAADARVGAGRRRVAIVANPAGRVALWRQRAAGKREGGLVIWDYHVVLIAGTMVWDLDTDLGAPVELQHYLLETFRPVPETFAPHFRVMDAPVYRSVFASDRRHMRGPDGSFAHPPPQWPSIGGDRSPTLGSLLDLGNEEPGEVLDLPGLIRRLGLSPQPQP